MVRDRYSNDASVAAKDVEYWMCVVCDNIDLVPDKKIKFVERCEKLLEDGRVLLPWEVSEIEHVYELVTATALGLESIKKHVDRKRRGLRF